MDELNHEPTTSVPPNDGKAPPKDTSIVLNDSAPKSAVENTTRRSGPTPVPSASILQRCTDTALDFLAHASNETLGACLVGLGATTYFALGRVGLLIIGVAGGVVLHATWDGTRSDDRTEAAKIREQEKKREAGIEVMRRLMQWREDGTAMEERAEHEVKLLANQALDFSGFDPKTETALNTFTDAIIADYVRYWYSPTVPEEDQFPAQCRSTLTAFLLSVAGHLQRKRPADSFLDFVTNASSIIVVFLGELSLALNASPNSPAEDAVDTYLKNKPESHLAHLIDKKHQDRKLGIIAEDVLEAYLDPKSFNCPPVHTFLKQILAQLVLGHTVTLCSAPAWINDYIIYGLEESETTQKVMDMVDAGVEGKSTVLPQVAAIAPVLETQPSKEVQDHKRQFSQAEDAMDEAMAEAKRLTQLMIEEDERRAREETERQSASSILDSPSQGIATPTSSDGDHDRLENRSSIAWSESSTAPTSELDTQPRTPATPQQFTSFDQILPDSRPTALAASPETKRENTNLTLHDANISIFDDSMPGEKTSIKAKPTTDYLIQIEPASGTVPGWMIARKYTDFEMLHEVLRRISVITGTAFTEKHPELPKWKTHTKSSLRQELERYLMDAVRFQPLAESEGMKRFLEKDQALLKGPNKGFGWPTPEAFGRLGGDMINVLAKAPKEVAGGGKALFGGLKGSKKNQAQPAKTDVMTPSSEARKSMQFPDVSGQVPARVSQESLHPPSGIDLDKPLPERSATPVQEDHPDPPSRHNLARTESYTSQASQAQTTEVVIDPLTGITGTYELPPPPSEMPDDYGITNGAISNSIDSIDKTEAPLPALPPRPSTIPSLPKPKVQKPPITERETSVAIELMFAVITELYTLSSAWQFRRTLLTAAKSFLLRPGNPQLLAIRDLLQKSLLDANLSDEGVAAQIYKMRENALPTAEEMEIWLRDYPEKSASEKEDARAKARKLLITKGMPSALTSVMGAAASGEALGRVFDCLQIPEVSRGLVFGLMLQALKVVTH